MRGLATHLGTPLLQARAKHSKGTVVVMSTYLTGQGGATCGKKGGLLGCNNIPGTHDLLLPGPPRTKRGDGKTPAFLSSFEG